MNKNILALDQSSRLSGWAVFSNENLISYGKIEAKSDDLGERLIYIRNEVKKLIEEYKIDFVVMEDIQLQDNVHDNVKTFKILAEVFGVIYELLSELKIENIAVLAGTWKSTLGIKGTRRTEQKKNAQLYVESTYNIKAIQDICDAICIGTHYLTKNNFETKITDGGFDWS